jgi:hypothetical protein
LKRVTLLYVACCLAVFGVSAGNAGAGGARSPATSAGCSKVTAGQVATRLHVGVDPVSGKTPIFGVLCGPFLGRGSQAMVASVAVALGCGGSIEWAVFRYAGGAWRLVMTQRRLPLESRGL